MDGEFGSKEKTLIHRFNMNAAQGKAHQSSTLETEQHWTHEQEAATEASKSSAAACIYIVNKLVTVLWHSPGPPMLSQITPTSLL